MQSGSWIERLGWGQGWRGGVRSGKCRLCIKGEKGVKDEKGGQGENGGMESERVRVECGQGSKGG